MASKNWSQKRNVVCNADGIAVTKLSQANAPQWCLLADRANGFSFADDRLCQKQHLRSEVNNVIAKDTRDRESRSQESLRAKRRRRNKKKRESIKKLSRLERKARYSRIPNQIIDGLKEELKDLTQENKNERKLSANCWKLYKDEKAKKLKVYRSPKNIDRSNLKEAGDISSNILGKGAFGTCQKMTYRELVVAVKRYHDHVKASSITWEAGVINLFDHPGLPMLFGICLEKKPYLMVTQFHGIDEKCLTLHNAGKSLVVSTIGEWTRLFREIGEALLYVHNKAMLHNDIKGDNVLLTTHAAVIHPILIDFGKCRRATNAKRYRLTSEEQRKYHKYHGHIAPELIKGTHCQSFASDIYSYGVLISNICKATCILTENERMKHVYEVCTYRKPEGRPTLEVILSKLKD